MTGPLGAALLLALSLLAAPLAYAQSNDATAGADGAEQSSSSNSPENAAVDEGLSGLARAVQERVGPTELAEQFQRWNAEADRARGVIRNDAASNAALEVMRERLQRLRAEADALAERQRARIEPLSRELGALGPRPEEGARLEEPALAALREQLNREISEENAVLAAAQLSAERFTVLLEDLSELLNARLRLRVLTRVASPLDPTVWANAADDMNRLAGEIASEGRAALMSPTRRAAALERAPLAALALVVGVAILWVGRRRLSGWVKAVGRDPDIPMERKVAASVAATVGRLALMIGGTFLFFFSIVAVDLFGLKVQALIEGAGRGVIFPIVAYALATAYYAPETSQLRLSELDDRNARRARSAAMTLSWAIGVATAITFAFDRLRLERDAVIIIVFLLDLCIAWGLLRLRAAYAAYVAPAASGAARTAGEAKDEDEEDAVAEAGGGEGLRLRVQALWLLRHAMLAIAVLGPLLNALGYFAAALELVGPAVRSLGVIGICALLVDFMRLLARGAIESAGSGAARFWRVAPLLTGALVAILAAPLFAMAWGASWADVTFAAGQLLEGVDVGGVTVSPVAFVTFAAVFGAGYALTGLFKRVLRTSVLPELKVDVGARSALESGVGYVGVILAALLAISAAGLDLSNLAIVAGALSVGVGFGLQTIVNNFVSGLILLIERPIRVGDWIEVNGVHGNVKRVNVRSTEIETFDRSDYIVPNSALISQPVTNYTRKNVLGRLIVKVGVAYASDPRQVETILREVAQKHPMVLRRPAPAILFRAFGADALEFEIRAYLRDVNYILGVGSDLHFAVAEKFREQGIEIPFGQRDIWFRNVDEVAAAFRRDAADPVPEPPREAAPPEALRGAAE
mgnify:CR=1 FL=1